MTIEKLLNLLCCPETRQPLRLLEPVRVEKLNSQISAGSLKNRAGKTISEKLDGGLVREDGKFLYPVRQEIPVLIIEEAIALVK